MKCTLYSKIKVSYFFANNNRDDKIELISKFSIDFDCFWIASGFSATLAYFWANFRNKFISSLASIRITTLTFTHHIHYNSQNQAQKMNYI